MKTMIDPPVTWILCGAGRVDPNGPANHSAVGADSTAHPNAAISDPQDYPSNIERMLQAKLSGLFEARDSHITTSVRSGAALGDPNLCNLKHGGLMLS